MSHTPAASRTGSRSRNNRKLANLGNELNVAVPQKWVGSSVALGFDVGTPWSSTTRSRSEAEVRRGVIVNVFDWGRSELNTVPKHCHLRKSEQDNRAKYWQYYRGGVYKLAYEAARLYHHWFGNGSQRWEAVIVAVYDFDSQTKDDLIGTVSLPLAATDGAQQAQLLDKEGRAAGNLTYSIEFWTASPGSRLAGAWRVGLVAASDLASHDQIDQSSDPFAKVTATTWDTGNEAIFRPQFQTCVAKATLSPAWGEVFEVPIPASPRGFLTEALQRGSMDIMDEALSHMFPPIDSADEDVTWDETHAFQRWLSAIDVA
ncbi:hypothetical protein CYMTET_19069 [Cymbomonas tetramitiformis]|uniref:C2 domain-containing protein n=1 Tax=Cymbomonas tetramitiformis TaxID=36881 RepID=A0AAE0G7F0_9CHLO|nr:hypothetical protein CYMTET_19069 [Cymbomonas tetramitiformis]